MRRLDTALDSPAWLHGVSAFTTVRVHDRVPIGWPAHVGRLRSTCVLLGLTPPVEWPEEASDACAGWPWALARITVTPQGSFWSVAQLAPGIRPEGVGVVVTDQQVHPVLGRHKTGAYLPYRLARTQAETRGGFEGWLLDAQGHVVDGTRTGLVLRLDGEMVVPDGGLASLTRARWMVTADREPWAVRRVALHDLSRVRGAWVCGAGVGVVPVSRITLNDTTAYDLEPRWDAPHDSQLVWPG